MPSAPTLFPRPDLDMKFLFHRARALLRPPIKAKPNLDAAAPLVQLLSEAEPAPELFAQIEAQIDDEKVRPPLYRNGSIPIAIFMAGLVIGALSVFALQDRQKIVGRLAEESAWIPLGSVTLHGTGLRRFVRAKCRGHTHFLIAMHAHSPTDRNSEKEPLMAASEKILMECIF